MHTGQERSMTAEDTRSAAARLAEFEGRLRDLQGRLDTLQARLAALEDGHPMATVASPVAVAATAAATGGWLTQARALARVAAVSFVLVIALVLRTLTDAGLVGKPLGVLLGMSYAASLIFLGWVAIVRDRFGQRVFPACGVVLMCALVAETHARFQYLSAPVADVTLLVVLAAVTALGRRYGAAAIVEIAVVATVLTGLAIGFPNPQYHLVTALLLLALVAAFLVPREHAWLHWLVLVCTLFFLGMWSFQLNALSGRGAPVPGELLRAWFPGALLAIFTTWLLLGVRLAVRSGQPSGFGLVLPPLNVAAAYAAAAAVLLPWLAMPRLLGAIGLVVAGLHLLLARSLERRVASAPAPAVATAFAFAGVVAFVPATALAWGAMGLEVPAWGGLLPVLLSWSAAALLLGTWAGRNGSAGLRLTGYALQTGAIGFGVIAGVFAVPATAWTEAAVAGGILAVLAGLHYRGNRRAPPIGTSWWVRLDPGDRAGVVLLWASLLAVFVASRIALRELAVRLLGDGGDAFTAAQSISINLMAIVLMGSGLRLRSKEQLATAILVAGVGGLKVFAADMFDCRGVPLVLSVFSFGVVTAVGSIVLGRWQRLVGAQSSR
jgi:hypothetical protein